MAFEFSFSEGNGDEFSLFEFVGGNPRGENSDSHSDLNEFFNRLHASEFEGLGEGDIIFGKITFDHFVGVALTRVKNEFLLRNIGMGGTANGCPRVKWTDDIDHFVDEDLLEVDSIFHPWL